MNKSLRMKSKQKRFQLKRWQTNKLAKRQMAVKRLMEAKPILFQMKFIKIRQRHVSLNDNKAQINRRNIKKKWRKVSRNWMMSFWEIVAKKRKKMMVRPISTFQFKKQIPSSKQNRQVLGTTGLARDQSQMKACKWPNENPPLPTTSIYLRLLHKVTKKQNKEKNIKSKAR